MMVVILIEVDYKFMARHIGSMLNMGPSLQIDDGDARMARN